MTSPALLPAPRRITASNLPLGGHDAANSHSEPGVEVLVDTIDPEPILGGALMRARIASSKTVPTSNDGHGNLELDDVPGMGIVLPGGLNLYYLDVAPKTEGVMHRTTSTDYLVVLQGTPSLLTPPSSFDVVDGQGTYDKPVETVCKPGDIVLQRGIMHAYVFQGGGTSLPSDLDFIEPYGRMGSRRRYGGLVGEESSPGLGFGNG
ncbi:hypothetical protein F4821DRAFT_256609 [Hypoxylon rubiginosum]|uniref:Uncharacterized protein n=1 Tax=Hypoxylon rubiginosum TaxID=110542 RepID=A0ACC0DAE2_9PEZI|nr:hypothetical protein F4821DRAFT_256609 [Hypoxylon rubiginosum]